ncbi:uncharacterized protein KRP23_5336 [Phytophthora ramorum]|uniref:uncharacterized protein n=1 Tax=Phytophthora ramorum TaxID=164328 RepID=UPI0030B593A6|nr:hypothetical protein KRP23_5336 [Phytophthora ramorum]
MEMTSSVMRFAMATYFMKRGGSSRPSQKFNDSSLASPSSEPSFATSYLSDEDVTEREEDEEVEEDVDSEFSHVVWTHVSNLRQLLVEVRFQEWSSGIAELREYVAANGLGVAGGCAVIEHLCFEAGGEPSQVFDELTELLLGYCCENKDACVATWLLRALNGITRGLPACVAGCHVNYEKSGSSFERERQRRGKFQRRVVRAEAKATERATADRVRKAYRSHPA